MAEQRYLTPEQLAAVKTLTPWRGLWAIAFTWGCIFGCWALYIAYPSVWTFLLGFIIITGRRLALAILMHEGAHTLFVRNRKWNDRISQWATAYPVLSDTIIYRMIHLNHHRYNWTKKDPDLGLATPFPITKDSFRRKVWRDLSGQTGWKQNKALIQRYAGLDPRKKGLQGKSLWTVMKTFWNNQWRFCVINLTFLAALTAFGHPEAFLLLWVLPHLTSFQLVLRIRSIAEHAVVRDAADDLQNTRTTVASWWVRFLMAPHNVNYHLEHHLFIYVPQYNLPKLHRMLRDNGVLDDAEVRHGYREVLRLATGKIPPAPDQPAAVPA